MRKYHNGRRNEKPFLKRGDAVYLLRKNIKTKRLSNKLDHVKLKPFTIEEKIGTINYKL